MDIKNAYTLNGTLDPQLYYVTLYNKIPSVYRYTVGPDEERDKSKIDFDYIKDLFTEIMDVRYNTYHTDKDLDKTQFKVTEFGVDVIGRREISLLIAADDKIFYIDENELSICYRDENIETVDKLAKEIFYRFPEKPIIDKTSKVSLIKVYQGDYYTSEKDIKPVLIDIDENYNDDFKKVYEDTIKFLSERSSGLILYWGIPGTGKTSLIRHLCSACPKEYVIVPNSIASRLGDPDLISFITDHTDSVFILEDCEQLLEDRSNDPFNNAISTILNMADGLLSDICNIKFICTFNAPVSKIDPALLRKGRCAAKYEFGKLCEEKVRLLNEKYNLGHEVIEPMTLADLYNADKTDYSDKEDTLKIGF